MHVRMPIDQSRQHQLSIEFDHLRPCSDMRGHTIFAADKDDPIPFDRYGLLDREIVVDGRDLAVEENQVSLRFSAAGDGVECQK